METSGKILGRNLRRFREARNWTQAELAERCDLSIKMIQKVEYAEASPSTKTIDTLCEALEVEPGELFAGSRKTTPTFGSAVDFLSKFEGLPPVMQRLVLGLVYQDASYGKGIKLSPELLASLQTLLGPISKAR